MKELLTFFSILFFSQIVVLSQIPNNGFENWTDSNPDSWSTTNLIVPGAPQFNIIPVTESSDAHSGTSAIKLEVLQTSFTGTPEVYAPLITSNFFHVSERYANLKCFVQFSPASENDSLILNVILIDDNTVITGATVSIKQALSEYAEVTVPINYSSVGTPDSVYVSAFIGADSLSSVGAYALLDDLTFEGIAASSIEEIAINIPKGFELKQNYPNPFNPSTNIEYSIPKGFFVELKVYDIIGNEVAVLVNQYQNAGTYKVDFSFKDGHDLTSGIYIARFSAGNFMKSIKMTILK